MRRGRYVARGVSLPRGARTASDLSARYEGVQVCADNQEVVDRSEIVITAVRRQDWHEALTGLRVDDDKIVVNVMTGVANDELHRTLATDSPLIRAIPLPAIRERRSVTVTYPTHPVVDSLFECLGGVLPVADETAFNVFSALTGTLTTHYSYLATLTSWAADQGIASDAADRDLRVRDVDSPGGESFGRAGLVRPVQDLATHQSAAPTRRRRPFSTAYIRRTAS
ncbi:NAD(P)-binding domain-containing protein [Streptomyces sp. NPDC020125]|uniref:NAD(P)-binding domain-containing protein n=1 Tax=Streptomyces sp. NPDC020125 TaxID=3154593 RepID=UPI0033DBD7D1